MTTEKSIGYIQQALRNMPPDNALMLAKTYLSRALQEIQIIENKRIKRQVQQKELVEQEAAKKEMPNLIMNPQQARQALSNIESMIAEEKKKISMIEQKPKTENPFVRDNPSE